MTLPNFPDGDADAARAWLRDRTLEELESWEDVLSNDPVRWTSLEKTLPAVVGMKSARLMKCIKEIIARHLSAENTMTPTTADKRKEIGKEAAAAILGQTDVEWKEDLGRWLEQAVTVFMPRAIKLWKKSQWKGKTKREDGSSQDGTSQMSSLANGRKRDSTTAASNDDKKSSKAVTSNSSDTHASKKVKIKTADPKGKMKEEYASAQSITQYQHIPNLDDWEIAVRLDDETFILVAVTTILKDDRLDQPGVDIRPEHLDFGKLLTLAQENCDSWESRDVVLYWGKDSVSIRDEEDFINAVGVMQFGLEQLCWENAIS